MLTPITTEGLAARAAELGPLEQPHLDQWQETLDRIRSEGFLQVQHHRREYARLNLRANALSVAVWRGLERMVLQ